MNFINKVLVVFGVILLASMCACAAMDSTDGADQLLTISAVAGQSNKPVVNIDATGDVALTEGAEFYWPITFWPGTSNNAMIKSATFKFESGGTIDTPWKLVKFEGVNRNMTMLDSGIVSGHPAVWVDVKTQPMNVMVDETETYLLEVGPVGAYSVVGSLTVTYN